MTTEDSVQAPILSVPASVQDDTRKYRFPPFPAVPEGVTIIPFKDFKENGIQMFDGPDEVERDGLGIPTIALRVKHDTDVSKTNPDRKKKTGKEAAALRPGFSKNWWEDWLEGEELRNHGPYNINSAPVDRFHQAASDFQKYRRFPPMATGVQSLWDQFRIFAGLLGTTPVWHKASDKANEDEEASDDDFEHDNSNLANNQSGSGEKRFPQRVRPRAPYELYGEKPTVVESDEQIQALLAAARAKKEDKVEIFLADPERAIKVFLSSYMKYQGLIWYDRNLVYAPHILRFFVNYLLRNNVLPDKTSERSLKAAIQIIDAAAKELPLTSKISKVLPDAFAMACQSLWGRKADGGLALSESDEDSITGEPDAKRVKLDMDPDAAFESVLKAENIELIKAEDVVPTDADATADPRADDSWGSGAWGSDDPSSSTGPADGNESWGGAPAAMDWSPAEVPSLLSLLGPTTLPLTHAPGVVEWSVRRIKSIVAPPHVPPKPTPAGDGDDWEADPDAVERDLEGRMYRVEMAPWPEWDSVDSDPELSRPRILRSSHGAVVTADAVADADAVPAPPTAVKPHNALEDKIYILLDPALADTLSVGMGLGGTWVQLARLQDRVDSAAAGEGEEAAKKTKKKKNLTKAQKEKRGLRYWYLDELMMILPSYWTA
ncbi:hypothetical protein C8J57DRAFT_1365554 [Mycena rebaudengoi]|nr:hypothetical protein C8J57DRAFT_1365554 [Mycena rebaudengoi]